MNNWTHYEVGLFDISDPKRVIFEDFQRPGERIAQAIEQDFNPLAVGTIAVAEVESGSDIWSVVDGGQRVRGTRRLDVKMLPACMYRGLSYDERAGLFLAMDHRTPLSAYRVHIAKLERNDTVACWIRDEPGRLGYYIVGNTVRDPQAVKAVGTLYRMAELGGAELIRRIFSVAHAWIPDEQLTTDVIAGLGGFLKNAPDDPSFVVSLRGWSLHDVQTAVAYRAAQRSKPNARGSGGTAGLWRDVFRQIARGELQRSQSGRITTELMSQITGVQNGRSIEEVVA